MERKTYVVTGAHRVFGYSPGRRFEREIPSGQEARLLASGALKRAARPTPTISGTPDAKGNGGKE